MTDLEPAFLHFLQEQPTGSGETITDSLLTAISLGILRVGDRLPPEPALARRLGVAVATLRKSLAELRELGVVATRRGRGGGTVVVRQPSPDDAQISRWLERTSVFQIRDLGDEHTAIAVAVARLACSRAHASELAPLEALVTRLKTAETAADRARADSRFHIQLAVAAQSPRLLQDEIRRQGETATVLWSPLVHGMTARSAANDHRDLLQAVRSGDAALAMTLAEDHIRRNVYCLIDAHLNLTSAATSPDETPAPELDS
ncbi:MAG: putative HTH-type transcriptional regulator RmpR [Pseudoclavibacter caeni]